MRIKKLYIKSFRGIPNELNLDFSNKSGQPISVIINGDNGSGKSSIVDAIEFNLQARIGRSNTMKNVKRPSPISYSHQPMVASETNILFDDDKENHRVISILKNNDGYNFDMDNKYMLPLFSLVPIVLRRNDIISLSQVAAESRQIFFFSFLYHVNIDPKKLESDKIYLKDDPHILELRKKYVEKKTERRIIVNNVIQITKMDVKTFGIHGYKDAENQFRSLFCYPGSNNMFMRNGNKKSQLTKFLFDYVISLFMSINKITDEITNINNEIKKFTKNITEIGDKRLDGRNNFLSEASIYLTDGFKKVSTAEYVKDIRLEIGNLSKTSLEIKVILKNGEEVLPNNIFSEANFDLLILMLYVSLIREGAVRGQSKVFIMDDVLQSVDSVIRNKFVDYILDVMPDWQLIITAHDRLWLNQLEYIFRRHSHQYKLFYIDNWNFEDGPTVFEQNNHIYNTSLQNAINTKDRTLVASMAGLTLEMVCQNLSVSLETSIHRREGDRYTIGDLWPAIMKELKKSTLKETVEIINQYLIIRNLIGCHYNEWALALSDQEIDTFAQSVLYLYDNTFCKECCSWTSSTSINNFVGECRCRKLVINKK